MFNFRSNFTDSKVVNCYSSYPIAVSGGAEVSCIVRGLPICIAKRIPPPLREIETKMKVRLQTKVVI
jgi:hypothetical protein